jgi:hypothetical protein
MLFLIQKLHNWLSRKLDVVAYLTAENLALRQQLIVLKSNQSRPSLKVRDRVFWKILSQVWPSWRDPRHRPARDRDRLAKISFRIILET